MKAYYYLFYKLYKVWDTISVPKFMSDWKAELSIDILEIFLGLSGIVYYTIATKKWIDFGDKKYLILIYILFIALPNYVIFHHKDKWKQIVHEFDKWPERKHKIGAIIAWTVVTLVVTNLFLSFYLMSQVDWKLYK